MAGLFDFFKIEDGVADDPDIELRNPTQPKRKRNRENYRKKNRELKEAHDLSTLSKPIGRENDSGNREYKWRLIDLTPERIQELTTQMIFRLGEGKGTAYYMLGINDDGIPIGISPEEMKESLSNIEAISSSANAEMRVLRTERGIDGEVAEVMVSKSDRETVIMDIRIILLGKGGNGKSTLIGVLTQGKKDNGKGLARMNICKHKHEALMGRTCSVSQHILGFDSHGDVTNFTHGYRNSSNYILDKSSKIITLIDLAGSEKYANAVVSGMCSQIPDYALLILDAASGFDEISLEHLKLAEALKLPLMIVITKVDKASQEELNRTLDQLDIYVKALKTHITNNEDIVLISKMFTEVGLVPIFQVSCVTGMNLDILGNFLNCLPVSDSWDKESEAETEFYIERGIEKDGKKILGGVVVKGSINKGQKMLLGPNDEGRFSIVQIKSIHCKHVPVTSVRAGQFCAFQVYNCGEVRSGMALLHINSTPRAAFEFQCEITPIDNVNGVRKLSNNYTPLIHTQFIRQCARVISEEAEEPIEIFPNKATVLKLRFLYHPEYIVPGTRLMVKDTFMTAIGKILSVEYINFS
ncbi:unnamed protein product [Blepharisma stoltei]|uniref:Tr-type G domain-containing protein n=1 Tax=Blepharisma stoltei TaxID=1481888 RepID=A0AAU9JYJ8_9CILI|nr:unnamed protein product [Blepharisma stoltei]